MTSPFMPRSGIVASADLIASLTEAAYWVCNGLFFMSRRISHIWPYVGAAMTIGAVGLLSIMQGRIEDQ